MTQVGPQPTHAPPPGVHGHPPPGYGHPPPGAYGPPPPGAYGPPPPNYGQAAGYPPGVIVVAQPHGYNVS